MTQTRSHRLREVADLGPTSTLIIGAHPDDVELLGLTSIGNPRESVTAVVCTDGAGAPRQADDHTTEVEYVAMRRDEQTAAADVGHYAQLVMLDLSSLAAKSGHQLVALLTDVLARVQPTTVITHNPADRHATHVCVARAVVAAARLASHTPSWVLGVEVWRDLDWLPDDRKVVLNADGLDLLADEILGSFTSQLAVKRYGEAAAGRRRANATFADPRSQDEHAAVLLAIDLTPAARGTVTLAELVATHIEEFRSEVISALEESL